MLDQLTSETQPRPMQAEMGFFHLIPGKGHTRTHWAHWKTDGRDLRLLLLHNQAGELEVDHLCRGEIGHAVSLLRNCQWRGPCTRTGQLRTLGLWATGVDLANLAMGSTILIADPVPKAGGLRGELYELELASADGSSTQVIRLRHIRGRWRVVESEISFGDGTTWRATHSDYGPRGRSSGHRPWSPGETRLRQPGDRSTAVIRWTSVGQEQEPVPTGSIESAMPSCAGPSGTRHTRP
jgi:hypothetical protein